MCLLWWRRDRNNVKTKEFMQTISLLTGILILSFAPHPPWSVLTNILGFTERLETPPHIELSDYLSIRFTST